MHLSAFSYILVHLISLEVDSDQSEACLDDFKKAFRVDGWDELMD